MSIVTSDVRGASTDSKVYLILHGADEDSKKLWVEGHFERAKTVVAQLHTDQMLSPLDELTVGIDYSGDRPEWHLDRVIFFCPNTGIEQVFPCNALFSKDQGERKIERILSEDRKSRVVKPRG